MAPMLYASLQVFGTMQRQVVWSLAHFHIDLSLCLKFMVYHVGTWHIYIFSIDPLCPGPPCLVLPCPVPFDRDSGQHQLQLSLPWPVLLTTSRSLKRNTSLWCAACFCSLFTSVTSKSRLQQTRRRCGMDSTWNPDRVLQ